MSSVNTQFAAAKYYTPLPVHKNDDYYSTLSPHLQLDFAKRLSRSLHYFNIKNTFPIDFDTFNFELTHTTLTT
jgi:hypothetical protein